MLTRRCQAHRDCTGRYRPAANGSDRTRGAGRRPHSVRLKPGSLEDSATYLAGWRRTDHSEENHYVMVGGQVYNPTAVNYAVGKSARWYLGQAGGITQIGDKNAAFVIRADGSVFSAKNNSSLWSGDPLNAVLRPGDSIVVPEKAPKIAPRNWSQILQAAQMASSVALTVAYIHP